MLIDPMGPTEMTYSLSSHSHTSLMLWEMLLRVSWCFFVIVTHNLSLETFVVVVVVIVAIIVSCNDHLGQDFLGKIINAETIIELENKGVDVCGENGEFHTVVLDCPLFARPIEVNFGEQRSNGTGYNFLELMIK